SVALSPDGKRLATGGGGHGRHTVSREDRAELKVWDAQTGRELLNLPVSNSTVIRSVAFSPDGKRLASGSGPVTIPGEVKIWDAQTGQELFAFKVGQWVSVVFSPDGKRLASAARGGVNVWDAQTGHELLALKREGAFPPSVAFSPDGRR